jgi:hypothetical protein
MKAFTTDDDNYEDNPVETINTTLFTACIKEIEKDMFLCLILTHENLYTDNAGEHLTQTISGFTSTRSLFREEDTHILIDTLYLYYDLFSLFHLSFRKVFEKSKELLIEVMSEFTQNFDRYFFVTDCGRNYFNNAVYRGFPI